MVWQVGKLEMKARVAMPPAARKLRAAMCPMLHVGVPEYVTMGGEDTAVYIYDISQQQNKGAKIVNKLQVCLLSQALALPVSPLLGIALPLRPLSHCSDLFADCHPQCTSTHAVHRIVHPACWSVYVTQHQCNRMRLTCC